MKFTMVWDDDAESIIRIDIHGMVGLLDYIVPMNDAAGKVLLSNDRVDVIINMAMSIPFTARSFSMVRRALLGTPNNLKHSVIVSRNPLTRAVIDWMVLRPASQFRERVTVTTSMESARSIISEKRLKANN